MLVLFTFTLQFVSHIYKKRSCVRLRILMKPHLLQKLKQKKIFNKFWKKAATAENFLSSLFTVLKKKRISKLTSLNSMHASKSENMELKLSIKWVISIFHPFYWWNKFLEWAARQSFTIENQVLETKIVSQNYKEKKCMMKF